jgi:hypothetical protein
VKSKVHKAESPKMIVRSLKNLLLGLTIVSFMAACDKNDPTAEPKDVYVAGNVRTRAGAVATYWKNGVAVSLPSGPIGGTAFAIAVSGSDVHVAGYIDQGNRTTAVHWKNGVPTYLSDNMGGSVATAIALTGSDVYIAGSGQEGQSTVICWKNNIPMISPNLANKSVIGYATSFSADGDLYVAGNENSSYTYWNPSVTYARYWKNWNVVNLLSKSAALVSAATGPVLTDTPNAEATAIAVAAGNVHVAGTNGRNAVYWKDGIFISSFDGDNSSRANAIAIYGNDVFVAGWGSESGAKYWKNGVSVNLGIGANPGLNSEARGIAVFGNHVYVAGYEIENNVHVAKYWKDGVAVKLASGTACAIIVK